MDAMKKVRSNSVDPADMSGYISEYFRLSQDDLSLHPSLRPPQIIDVIQHPLKINKHRKYLRVSSVPKTASLVAESLKVKPLNEEMVDEMKEMDM